MTRCTKTIGVCGGALVLVFVALAAVGAEAQTTQTPAQVPEPGSNRRLVGTHITTPIQIDGSLDDEAWQQAAVATGFTQSEPEEGQPATEETEVRILYDDANLYIGAFLHDRDTSRIVVGDLKKDFQTEGGDSFEVVLDTFHDLRNGYVFATNAGGAKWDAQMVNEGREVNSDWDAVWRVQTRVLDNGWTVEIAIPFATLKFNDAEQQTWGVNFYRRIAHRNEETYWAPIPRQYRLTRVSMAGELEGLTALRGGRELRIKPYALTSGSWVGEGDADPDADLGIDVKYGITSGLTWDFTVNTDFSQVESDEQQVNLGRVSLFFPEKREFFLENSGIFQFGAGDERGQRRSMRVNPGGGTGSRLTDTANTQNDLVLFFSRRIGLSEEGTSIPILAGTRLTGQAGGFNVGVLSIQQRDTETTASTNFSAFAVRRPILARSDVGVIMLNKDEQGAHFNRVVGASANFRFYENVNFNGFVARTFSPDAVRAAQPGNEMTARFGFNYPSPSLDVRASLLSIGPGFNDEMGFVRRIGVNKFDTHLGYRLRPRRFSGWLREIDPHIDIHDIRRWEGGLESQYNDYHLMFRFQDSSTFEVGYNWDQEDLRAPFLLNRRHGVVLEPKRYEFGEYFASYQPDLNAVFQPSVRYGIGEYYDGESQSIRVGTTTRVNEQFNFQFNVTRIAVTLPAGNYTTNLISSRINYNFSTQMFLNALLQYSTDSQQWSSNVRFNIIHRPLSDIFLVYNDQRDTRLGGGLMNRSIVAKMTYLMQF